jgi:hypothetical protein
MGNCFRSNTNHIMAIPSKKEEKTKEEGNPINNLHPLLEPFIYPVDRQPPTTIDVDL